LISGWPVEFAKDRLAQDVAQKVKINTLLFKSSPKFALHFKIFKHLPKSKQSPNVQKFAAQSGHTAWNVSQPSSLGISLIDSSSLIPMKIFFHFLVLILDFFSFEDSFEWEISV
jgi:hypothetical protein